MKFMYALIQHAWLAIRLKHNGNGMPTKIPSASALMLIYVVLTVIERNAQHGITLETIIGLAFISQCYIFGLRNKVIGLIILIGIISNTLSIALAAFATMSTQQFYIVAILEYIMVFFSIINVIKSNMKIY